MWRRADRHVANIANLICALHLFFAQGRTFACNLKALPLSFLERLVVCQLAYQVSHFVAKMLLKLPKSGVGILDGIVEGSTQ